MPSAKDIIKRSEVLDSQRATWDGFWSHLANYIQIRKGEINTTVSGPDAERAGLIYDSTAQQANQTLASGQMSLVSPVDDVWFEFKPPLQLKDNMDAIAYYRSVSEVVRDAIANSNFYTQMHEMYLQRGGFGTAVIFSNINKGKLFFKSYDVGTYSICEDETGEVDTFFRTFELTARQAVKKFGEENVHATIRAAANDLKKCDMPFQFINAVMPRDEIKAGDSEVKRMPIASYYVDVKNKVMVEERGFESFPHHVTRFLPWSDKNIDPYGWCPGWTALPDIRQGNFLAEMLDVLAETAAYPRIVSPSTLKGEIDLRAAGITYFDPVTDRDAPKEWATQGRYDIGIDRLKMRQAAINEAYHVDLFKLFDKLERGAQMSIMEVTTRNSEKLLGFSPTFTRMTTELFTPMLKRVFSLVGELGLLNAIPVPEVLVSQDDGGADITIAEPGIRYMSAIALALESLQNRAAMSTLEVLGPLVQFKPDVLDPINFDTMVPGFARNLGMPEAWLRTQAQINQIAADREQAMKAQQEAEIQKQQSEADRNDRQ